MTRENRFRSVSEDEDTPVDEGEYDERWPARLPSSSRRYDLTTSGPSRPRYALHPAPVQRAAIPARRSAQQPASRRQTEETVAPARHRRRGLFRAHPLLWLGVGMLFMLLLWVGLQNLGAW